MEKLEEKLEYISELIGEEINPQNPDQMLSKLGNLINYAGHMAAIVADAERNYKYAILDAYKKTEADKPPSTVHSKVLEAMVADASSLYTYADRMNASLKMAVEGLRTMISLYKVETENSTR